MTAFDDITREMGWKEKLATWMLVRWLKNGGKPMLYRMLGNWQTTLIGLLAAVTNQLQAAGVFPQTKADWVRLAQSVLMLVLGTVAKDAQTGSSPGDR